MVGGGRSAEEEEGQGRGRSGCVRAEAVETEMVTVEEKIAELQRKHAVLARFDPSDLVDMLHDSGNGHDLHAGNVEARLKRLCGPSFEQEPDVVEQTLGASGKSTQAPSSVGGQEFEDGSFDGQFNSFTESPQIASDTESSALSPLSALSVDDEEDDLRSSRMSYSMPSHNGDSPPVAVEGEHEHDEQELYTETDTEYGADVEAQEVAMHAWVELSIHRMHATTQGRLALGLQYTIIGINVVTALMATIETQVVVDAFQAAVRERRDDDQRDRIGDVSGLRALMVLLPLVSGLCLALLKGFNFGTKAASLEYSSAAIRSEIYRWRTRTGEYAASRSSTIDQAELEGSRRKRFREQVSHLQMGDTPAWHGNSLETADGEAATAKPPSSVFASLGLGGAAGRKGQGADLRSAEQFASEAQRVATVAQARELAALHQGKLEQSDGNGSYQYLEEDKMRDDGWGTLDYAQYIEFRLNPVIGMLRSKVPELELQLQACQLGIFCLTALCVLLAAIDTTLWLPLMLLLTASVSAVSDVLQLHPKLLATNCALAQLKELQLWWSSLERFERDDEGFSFDVLVEGVETAFLSGLGTGVPYARRKVNPWRAEDDKMRYEMHEQMQHKTEKRHAKAKKKYEAANEVRQQNKSLMDERKELQKRLEDEKRAHFRTKRSERELVERQKISARSIKALEQQKLDVDEQLQQQRRRPLPIANQPAADYLEPRECRWADESWRTLATEAPNLLEDCKALGYGTQEAWDSILPYGRDGGGARDFRGRHNWESLSREQKLAANRLGLYKPDFEISGTRHFGARPTRSIGSSSIRKTR